MEWMRLLFKAGLTVSDAYLWLKIAADASAVPSSASASKCGHLQTETYSRSTNEDTIYDGPALTLCPFSRTNSLQVGGLAGAALGLLYFLQEKVIYVPVLPGIPRDYPYYPDEFGLKYEDVWFSAADNTRLHAWLIWPSHWAPEQRRERPVIVFFQENGESTSRNCCRGKEKKRN
jgi:hypothetical protein